MTGVGQTEVGQDLRLPEDARRWLPEATHFELIDSVHQGLIGAAHEAQHKPF